jgi:hypothetical protein
MSVSGVLASLRGSTYRSVRFPSSLAAALPAERRVLARRGWAGENRGLFEHPIWLAIANVLEIENSSPEHFRLVPCPL